MGKNSAVSKANRILGMIKRNFVDRLKETILLLCKTTPGILLPNMESSL